VGIGVPSESAATIRHLIRTAASCGVRLEEGESSAEPPFRARVAVDHASQLWEQAARELGPAVALLVANKRTEDRISPLFFAAMSQRTLGDALQSTVRHWRYATEAIGASLIRRGATVRLGLEPRAPMSLGACLGMDYLIADLARSGGDLAATEWRPIEIVLARPPTFGVRAWEDLCGVRVRVDPDAPGLVMDRDSLEVPVRAALPRAAGALFSQILEWATPPARTMSSTAERVAAELASDLECAPPSIEQVARELGLSTRTLHRRLSDEATSFQRVLDTVRRDAAIRCLRDRERQLKTVAAAVGFADMRSFRRAFKRWTGLSPQQFRLEQLPDGAAPADAHRDDRPSRTSATPLAGELASG
jgi:AraC-like DNA-binding protein